MSLAPSTFNSYRAALKSLDCFCREHNIELTLPVTTDLLCLWVTRNALRLSHSSIRTYLHGIGTMHTLLGHPNPVDGADLVWRAYLGAKRVQDGETTVEKRLPITVELLLQLERWQNVDSSDGRMQRAAMWLGTCGLLRSGEFVLRDKDSVLLKRCNLSFRNEEGHERGMNDKTVTYMQVRLDRSKTDQQQAGVNVVVSHPTALQTMRSYLAYRSKQTETEALFLSQNGKPLTYNELMQRTRALLLAA